MDTQIAIVGQPIVLQTGTLNITWNGQNGDLPDQMAYDLPDASVLAIATEAVRNGDVPGIAADPVANFTDFIVDRFPANQAVPTNRLVVRPKTPFGS